MTPAAHERVDAALRAASSSVERLDASGWRCTLRNGAALTAEARIRHGWLILEAPAATWARGAVLRDRAWEVLAWNGRLHGLAKFALCAPGAGLHLRAELPLADEIDLGWRLAATTAGFMEGAALLRGEPFADHLGAAGAGAGAGSDLAALVGEAGWPYYVRTPSRLAVDLEVRDAVHQAIVERREDGEGTIRVSVDLETDDGAVPATRALAVLLLEACAAIRFVRAAAGPPGAGSRARLECTFADGAAAIEIGHALAALSVACACCAREAAILLRDHRVAARFEALRPFHDHANDPAAAGKPTKED